MAHPTPAGADETALAQRAAAGDGDAFATLYERYEKRTYNLCLRILGGEDDAADATQEAFVKVLRRLPKLQGGELAFGSYVFTSARNACYDLIERRRRTEPSDTIFEHATPMGGGVGGGGIGFDPGDPEDDPERNVLLDARTDEIRAANQTLPERQREALALKELDDLSYDEIAAIMGMNRNSVAQLISRARINLRDALRGSALASIAPTSPDCERALPLIAARQDGQLGDGSADAAWLGDHLVSCHSCRLGREGMAEAGISYRAWVPIAAAPWLFRETMAEAAELVGADWSDVVARREAERSTTPGRAAAAGAGAGGVQGARAAILRHRRRNLALLAALVLALVLVVFVGATAENSSVETVDPAAEEEPVAVAEEPESPPAKPKKKARRAPDRRGAAAPPAETGEAADPPPGEPAADEPVPVERDTGARTRRPSKRGRIDRPDGGRDRGRVTGDPPTTTQPPAETTTEEPPPPPPPPTDTTPTDPPATCRDANGQPIPCTSAPPTTPCPPTRPNCAGGGPPPRRGP